MTNKIHSAMAAVMDELGAIGKDSKNQQQGFMFRGIDQAYNAIHPLMAKHKVFTVPRTTEVKFREERQTRNGGIMTYTVVMMEYDFVSGEDGSKITVGPIMGEGADTGDKSCNKAMAIAHKYALFQTFLIPTEKTDDPDFQSHEVVAASPADMSDPWGEAPQPPPIPQTLAPSTASNGTISSISNTDITTEEEAAKVTDLIIQLATSMHSGSLQSITDFRNKNIETIKYMRDSYPAQFERIKDTFTAIRQQQESNRNA